MTNAQVKLYTGRARPLSPNNRPSAIVKTHAQGVLWLGKEGLQGDEQADRSSHGGAHMALHQYPQAHYARLAAAFPATAPQLSPGSIGENLSAPFLDESAVCIGDIFQLGAARIEVSQPRTPCHKIDERFGVTGMAQFINDQGITGWYYRVLQEGEVAPGCAFTQLQSPYPSHTLARLWALWQAHRPPPDDLIEYAALSALSPSWREKLSRRAQWLHDHAH